MNRMIPIPQLSQDPQPMMHKVACKNCPSAHHPIDAECADILTWPKAERVQTAFPCGWSPVRYCRGYCNMMGITDKDLASKGE